MEARRFLLGVSKRWGPRMTALGSEDEDVQSGVAGAVVDLLSRRLLPDFPFKPDSYFSFSPKLCLAVLAFSLLSCVLGALFPARSAARLSPAASLTAL